MGGIAAISISYWLSVGAQPSDRVAYLLWRTGLLPPPPIHLLTKGHKAKGEEKAKPKAPAGKAPAAAKGGKEAAAKPAAKKK